MATARDKALQEISKLSPEARAYLTALAKKSNAMNQRSMGSGDEYVKGQVRASQGKPKRSSGGSNKPQGPPAPRMSASSPAVTSRAATKPKNQTAKKSSSSGSSSRPLDTITAGRMRRPIPKSNSVSKAKGKRGSSRAGDIGR